MIINPVLLEEEYEKGNLKLNGHTDNLIAFGAGNRSCPAQKLGIGMIKAIVAGLIGRFNIKKTSEEKQKYGYFDFPLINNLKETAFEVTPKEEKEINENPYI